MKLKNTTQAKSLASNNTENLGIWSTKKLADTPYFNLIRLIAELMDAAANGQNAYVTIGTTKSGGAFVVTVHLDGDQDSEYAAEFASLCRNLTRLTDNV